MAGHPQSSPRGFFAKQKVAVSGNEITADGTTLIFPAAIKISALQQISGLSTGLVWADNSTVGAIPANVTSGVDIGIMTNSTGTAAFINLTGTTHKYLSVTTKQPS